MRRKRVSQATSRSSSAKCSSASGSRSMHTSVPLEPIRSAIRRAWPPAPKVQSTTVSPAAGAVSSISSPARTGTCARVMSRRIAKALRHLPDFRVQSVLLLLPALLRPHLEVVAHPHHEDLLLDPGVLEEWRRQGHTAARVELDLEGVALVEARQLAVLGPHRVQLAECALDDRLVRLGSPHRDAGLRVLGENRSTGEGSAEPGRNAEPVLRVQRVLEVATKRHRSYPGERVRPEWRSGRSPATPVDCWCHRTPLSPTLQHDSPLFRPMAGSLGRPLARFWLPGAKKQALSAVGHWVRPGAISPACAPPECNRACKRGVWWVALQRRGFGLGAFPWHIARQCAP